MIFVYLFLSIGIEGLEVRERPTCEPLESFLGNFGNEWNTDCSDTADGALCYAGCGISEAEVYVLCSCNGNRCYWIPNEIQLQEADWEAQTLTLEGPR